MKKIFISSLAVALLCSLSSCKKDYSCTCTVTYYGQAGSINIGSSTSTIKINMKSVSKKTAKSNCVSGKVEESNTKDYIIQDCKLN
ncbi:MAG: hypothetical protein V4580_14325 [Bacteroidota bacterium]